MTGLKEIKESLYDKISGDIEEADKEDFEILKNNAREFLQQMKNLNNSIGKINYNHQELLNSLIESTRIEANGKPQIDQKDITLYIRERKNIRQKRYIQVSLILAHRFENSLNEYLNRRIFLTYVTKEGEIIAFNEGQTEAIYNEVSKKKKTTGSINLSKSKINEYKKKSNEEDKQLMSTLNNEIQEIAKNKNKIFQKAIKRWEKNKGSKDNRYYYWNYKKQGPHITDIIPNRGYIAEGYADAVINKDNYVRNDYIESSLYRLWKAHINPEAIPAPVKGDVVQKFIENLNQNEQNYTSLQFAIKYGSASTASVSSYIYLANNIIQLNIAPDKDYFKLALPLLVKQDNINVRQDLEASSDKINNNMKKLIDQMVDRIVKDSTTDKAKQDQIKVIQENFDI